MKYNVTLQSVPEQQNGVKVPHKKHVTTQVPLILAASGFRGDSILDAITLMVTERVDDIGALISFLPMLITSER